MHVPGKTEVWLRGPVPQVIPVLQPVAHALLQAEEELTELMRDFPDGLLWQQPAGMASAGFHLQHMTGVLDRLFTYAAGQMLSEGQLAQLGSEGRANATSTGQLVSHFTGQVSKSLARLRQIDAGTIFENRDVGRAKLPSTVLGLLVHAAEHTMRHLGQLLVTVKVVNASQV